jgi:hypothetical protein
VSSPSRRLACLEKNVRFRSLGYYCVTEGPLKGLESLVFSRKYAIHTQYGYGERDNPCMHNRQPYPTNLRDGEGEYYSTSEDGKPLPWLQTVTRRL